MLPKIEYPKTEVALVSTGKKVYIRPMTIRDEKILLLAGETGDRRDILNAVVQILEACVEGNVTIRELPSYDVEWLFMKLRAQSVSNVVKMQFTPEDSDKSYPFQIDLDKVEMTKPKKSAKDILDVQDGVAIKLRHAPIKALLTEDEDPIISSIMHSIESITSGDTVTKASDIKDEELREWVNGLSAGNLEKITEYVNEVPTLVHEEVIDLDDGTKETVRLASIFDFFSL